MRIYVAGPYSAPTNEERLLNTARAMDVGYELLKKGHNPFIPHLTHYFERWALAAGRDALSYEDYMRWDESWLTQCEALYFLGPSPGANVERRVAEALGLTIFTSLEEVPTLGWGD